MVVSRSGTLWCRDERRSGVLRDPAHPLNGVDYVEYRRAPLAPPGQRHVLEVVLLKPLPAAPPLAAADFTVSGGVRIVNVQVLDAQPDGGDPLRMQVFLDREGDFSTYVLQIDHPEIDLERSETRFSFKAGCPSEFDCRPPIDCPPEVLDEPTLSYLAKDYQSFRRLMTDLIALRNPDWRERLPADLGMAVVEALAYAGDYLSYYQDAAPGTEAYLDTCLHRVSAGRHVGLIDYRMHNGRNAVTHVHFTATAGSDGVVPAGAGLTTRIAAPLVGAVAPPGPVLPGTADFDGDPALLDATVFETAALVRVTDLHNELRIHTWNDALCCIARGTTQAYLYAAMGAPGAETAVLPELDVGDYVLFEEVLSPQTGFAVDADSAHRQVVRLVEVEPTGDDAFTDAVPGGALTPRINAGDPSLPLLRVVWRVEDALRLALCVSAESADGVPIAPVSVARGNIAPADHGRTVRQDSDDGDLAVPEPGVGRWPLPSLSLPLAPVTHQAMPTAPVYTAEGRLVHGRHDLDVEPDRAVPAVTLILTDPDGQDEIWTPVPNLLDSGPYDRHFVAEIDNDGEAALRFGDDQFGQRPLDAARVRARYRVGNGREGNIGSGSLLHVVAPDPAEPLDPANPGAPLVFASVDAVYQPLAAIGGVDAESIEGVRQTAPEAFHAIQYRAVTVADWEEAALRLSGVAAAKARFRWTGSWHTVFVAIHPRDGADLHRLPGGGVALEIAFARTIRAHLTRFKLAGYDLAVRAAQYVPLEIELRLCVTHGHFRGDVLDAVARALSDRQLVDGSRGFFHPLRFGFGEAVYLSQIYAAVDAIDGVDSASVLVFKRYWDTPADELDRGLIPMGPFEIPRLDNDPNFPENGVLRLSAVGGL
jgi:hypothetical protein